MSSASVPPRRRSVTVPVLAVLIGMGLVLVGCAGTPPEPTLEGRVELAEAELVEDGADPDVADCVVRLARHELRRGSLDGVTRDELLVSCERAQAAKSGKADVPPSLSYADGPDTLGDDPALDRLWRSCEEGSGVACDQLFADSPVGSDYEQFGVSCGRRDELLDCSELDEADGDDTAG